MSRTYLYAEPQVGSLFEMGKHLSQSQSLAGIGKPEKREVFTNLIDVTKSTKLNPANVFLFIIIGMLFLCASSFVGSILIIHS